MAFTVTKKFTSVFGNKRVTALLVTPDAVSGVIDSGLSVIDVVTYAPKSMTSGGSFRANELTAATASNGKLHMVDFTSGDDVYVVCYGR